MESSSSPSAGGTGPSVVDSSGDDSPQDMKEQAKEKAQQASARAEGMIREQVDQRSTQAGERIGSTAQDLRSVGEQLRSQQKDAPARLADQAAERTEQVAGYLRDSDADTILRDVEDFGRRQPWVVAVGGVALGLLAARFLKASSSERYRASQSAGQPAQRQIVTPTEPSVPYDRSEASGQRPEPALR
jgi:hypothetical protein